MSREDITVTKTSLLPDLLLLFYGQFLAVYKPTQYLAF